jgi:secondary thiamine-phosphate synthase enzyme
LPVSIKIKTDTRIQMVDITHAVQEEVSKSGVHDGVCTVYVPHTTAGITINEGADPSVCSDILNMLNKLVPSNAGYRHMEGNADSHIKASIMGSSANVIIENGRLVLGTWQKVFFCEFDGPRSRKIYVKF